jgi:hypothetical protein
MQDADILDCPNWDNVDSSLANNNALRLAARADVRHRLSAPYRKIFESPHCHRCGKVQKGGIHMLFRALVARWQHLGCLIRSDGSVSRQHLGHWVK